MFFIHETSCISPQKEINIFIADLDPLERPVNNKFHAIEPEYKEIPQGILRRMGKAVRLGVGAAMSVIKETALDGIIIGTSMGGMEDCIKFLNQVIEYDEGLLTPTNFVQSTPNAIAGQVGLLSKNKGYNITHVHRGFSFEIAVVDAMMRLTENNSDSYLLGAVDEISDYNYNIERLDGWYRKEVFSGNDLFASSLPGTIAGEGSAMFIVNNEPFNAIAGIKAIHFFQTDNENLVSSQFKQFMDENMADGENADVFLSGENGDSRFLNFYDACEHIVGKDVNMGRFKHLCGEYPTASAFAMWLACEIIRRNILPATMIKHVGNSRDNNRIIIYNNYKGVQHSFMLLEKV